MFLIILILVVLCVLMYAISDFMGLAAFVMTLVFALYVKGKIIAE